ncbi:predicted protein [Nematostella vectensis]|uniref:PKD/REJ-like domain-containing protein n=1 Tax=Nematostella vectensis TaxID=45351 RepID=A7SE33_NEMVE|nr:predicted protein [Nematostella vectensis]|eukprot:XP_001630079.1 predicted protein [Nematostella vectensis]
MKYSELGVTMKYSEVVKSPLSCHIFGGSARTDGNAIKGEVDASASFDPDSPPHTDHALHFMWYCWAVDPTQRAQLLASGHKDPLPHLEPPLGANLTTGCFGQFPGLLSFNGSRFEYDAGMRRTTSMFVIALKLSKDSRVQYCQQVRTLLDANVPSVSSRSCRNIKISYKLLFKLGNYFQLLLAPFAGLRARKLEAVVISRISTSKYYSHPT